MNARVQKLLTTQLDDRLQVIRQIPKENLQVPRGGWIAAIRKALGMSGKFLAMRMGVSQSAQAQYEKSEKERSISLQTLAKIADALDADLVYVIVPRKPLWDILEERALEMAKERVLPLAHSMGLESQATSLDHLESDVKEIKNRLLEHPRELWR
jgi:predicted DNA-binding mobile mystery protein A